ncbi:hypothetical protein ACTXT7_002130 [Hymenolepis weldensis]
MSMNWPPRGREKVIANTVDSLTKPELVRRVHCMMDENPGKSMRDILPSIFKGLKEQQRGRRFMLTKTTKDNHLMPAKPFLRELKDPEEQECLWLKDEKVN